MKKTRSELREEIIKIIYQTLLFKYNKMSFDADKLIKEQIEVTNDFIDQTVKSILENYEELETLINKYLKDWTLNRLGLTDQAVLLLGVYELMYTETPKIVVIDEAVELSKKYSDESVRGMINGVLDKIYHEECDHE